MRIMLAMGLFYSVYINSKLTLLVDIEVKIAPEVGHKIFKQIQSFAMVMHYGTF